MGELLGEKCHTSVCVRVVALMEWDRAGSRRASQSGVFVGLRWRFFTHEHTSQRKLPSNDSLHQLVLVK